MRKENTRGSKEGKEKKRSNFFYLELIMYFILNSTITIEKKKKIPMKLEISIIL